MSGLRDEFVNDMCDYMYPIADNDDEDPAKNGRGWTPQDKRNLLRNIKPAYDGTAILSFGTKFKSECAMEFFQDCWEYKEKYHSLIRKKINEKKQEKQFQFESNLVQKEREENEKRMLENRQQCAEIERGAVENSSIYHRLLQSYNKSINIIKEQQNHLECQDKLKKQIESITIEKSELEMKIRYDYQEKYKKDRKKDEKEKQQWKNECEKQQDKIIFMELRERIKKLEKQNKNLQQQLIQSMD